jgi:glycosyltransferase involved in cell wall biosynthesis
MPCPLCAIPSREPLHYQDDLVYVVDTKEKKGHTVRCMAAVKRHTATPTFEERQRCLLALYEYMGRVQGREPWFIVDGTYGSIPEHYHVVACDGESPDLGERGMMAKTPKIGLPLFGGVLIGIPAHNEERRIGGVVHEARKHGQVLVYCDGCTDATVRLAREAGADYVVDGSPNLGYGGALDQIFSLARHYGFRSLVVLDGDGQHDPAQVPQFLWGLRGGSDLVIGNRFIGQHNTPAQRQMVIRTINAVLGVGDSQCGFRAYGERALEAMRLSDYGMGASLEVLHIARERGLKVAEVPCSVRYEEAKRGDLAHGRMLVETLFWSLIWGRPLRTLVLPAVLLGGYGLYALLKTVYIYRVGDSFAIGLSVVGVGSLLAGLMLFLSAVIVLVGKRQLTEMRR